jgi:hypothetical protein
MKLQKIFFPLAVVASVLAVYAFFRKSGGSQSITSPSTGASGVPEAYTSQGQVQPVNYQVAGVPSDPSPLVVLSNPFSSNPGGTNISTPPYLAYNLGPGNLLNTPPTIQQPETSNCGCDCGGSCANQCGVQNGFSDGSGQTQLVTTRKKQLAQSSPKTWQPQAIANANAYLALESQINSTPNLTSWMPGGMIN